MRVIIFALRSNELKIYILHSYMLLLQNRIMYSAIFVQIFMTSF